MNPQSALQLASGGGRPWPASVDPGELGEPVADRPVLDHRTKPVDDGPAGTWTRWRSMQRASLPQYGTLQYLEKLGIVLLTFAAIAYLVGHGVKHGAASAGAVAARAPKGA